MVVVKPPELEKIAIDPLSSTSSGLSPPSAPPMRTRFRIRHPEAIGAENVDPVGLAERADLARIMHRDLLGDHHDLLELWVHPDELGHAVTHARRRQVDDARIEHEPDIEPFANVVVDGNVALRRR